MLSAQTFTLLTHIVPTVIIALKDSTTHPSQSRHLRNCHHERKINFSKGKSDYTKPHSHPSKRATVSYPNSNVSKPSLLHGFVTLTDTDIPVMLPLYHCPSNQCSHNASRYHKCIFIYILVTGEGNPELLTQCLPWFLYRCMREPSNSSIATSLYITCPDTQQLLVPWTMAEICMPICCQLKQYRLKPWLVGCKGQLINFLRTHMLPGR